jgi:MmyB-like transcription regulator ligand binding domain
LHPQGLRPFIVNWEICASHLLQRLHRETLIERDSNISTALLNEVLGYPDIDRLWKIDRHMTQHTLLFTIQLQRDRLELKFFSTIATMGTPYDITLQELRLECLFPADAATEHNWQQYQTKCSIEQDDRSDFLLPPS